MSRWMLTASGHELNLANPQPGAINIYSIANSLAQINRFTGHARRPYSVAEHSLLVADICRVELGLDVHGILLGALHDGHESIVGDCGTPMKQAMRDLSLNASPFDLLSDRAERRVLQCFGLLTTATVHGEAVRRADLIALATERRDLMPPGETPWEVLRGIQPLERVRLNTEERAATSWLEWRRRFLELYEQLDYHRVRAAAAVPAYVPAPAWREEA